MATIYNETEDKVEFQNKYFRKNRESIHFTLEGNNKLYHITIEGEANVELTLEESELTAEAST